MSAIGCDSRHCENAMRSMTITSISRRATSLACYASLREREQDHMRETLATINKYAYAQYTHESSRREMLVRKLGGGARRGYLLCTYCNLLQESCKVLRDAAISCARRIYMQDSTKIWKEHLRSGYTSNDCSAGIVTENLLLKKGDWNHTNLKRWLSLPKVTGIIHLEYIRSRISAREYIKKPN